jgi:hypothetical protein
MFPPKKVSSQGKGDEKQPLLVLTVFIMWCGVILIMKRNLWLALALNYLFSNRDSVQ